MIKFKTTLSPGAPFANMVYSNPSMDKLSHAQLVSEVWNKITHPFPKFSSCTVEVWE